jgi:hypothetical protein
MLIHKVGIIQDLQIFLHTLHFLPLLLMLDDVIWLPITKKV